jgi:hypothetical protein
MKYFLIWSEEHGAWWAPASRGYTRSMKRAGRYSKDEAERFSTSANGGGTFCEVPVEISDDMLVVTKLPSGGR